ncbi:sugar-phosphatase [Fructilactobacillus myrtifloralis]|uniref:Sugar-phosphatase n=1 Tax=Fructilactobacillus myrtifloralis TaxID=2940301 RepID=A0ABY5BMF8_9LACO|nr:sugar-phosphatase [Fructilactobacillus myrtifloralis]USS84869.1 sugar-phosphatase [Fructilactobacillus myrtifloralis]
MTEIKLIAIDIDGTLLNEQNELAPATIKAIKAAHAQGVKIVLCSGRPLAGIRPYLKPLGLSGEHEYAIAFNGAIAEDLTGQIIFATNVHYQDYLEVEMMAREMGVHFQIETNDGIYTTNRDISKYSVYESQLVNLSIHYRTPEEITPDFKIAKLMFIDEPDQIDLANHNLPDSLKQRMSVVKSTPVFLEFMNAKAGKGPAVKQLAEKLGLTAANVMAIGDQENDLSMIKYAHTGVAMGNAIADVKEQAQFVTKPNSQDGVAYAINQFVLNAN